MKLNVNDIAPDFTLYSSEKEKVTLSDFRGQNLLLLFFPQAFSGVCTAEMCAMRDDIGSYQNLDTTVLAVSVDSVFTLAKFKEIDKLNFTLLSDFNKEVIVKYGCVHENFAFEMKNVAYRSAFIIDKQGMIRYAQVNQDPKQLPDFDLIKSTLATL